MMMTRSWSPRALLSSTALVTAALVSAAVFEAQPARADLTEVGRAAAVNPLSEGTPPGQQTRRLLVGTDVFFEERIVTSGEGQTQILFTDESTLTVGPNAEIVIDSYVFDPNTGEGEISMNLVDGALRYVGGRISKGGGVNIETPTATIGIRGGINLTSHDQDTGTTESSNVFGQQTITKDGQTQIIQKGWTAQVNPDGTVTYTRTETTTVQAFQRQMEGDGGGGAEEQPTDENVANSGLPQGNSDLDPSLAQALAQQSTDTGTPGQDDDGAPDPNQVEDSADTSENNEGQSGGNPNLGGNPNTGGPFAGTPLVNGFGGPSDFGRNFVTDGPSFVGSDDGSSAAIDITPVFENGLSFAGVTIETLFVNNNGNVTFGAPLSTFTPFPLNGDTQVPIIAPFFADVDTSSGSVTPTPGGNSTGSNLAWYAVDPETDTVTATWDDVGYFGDNTDRLNAFQVQLVDQGGGDFDIVFRYEDINWTTGDASGGEGGLGGTAARAGVDIGNGADFFELPASGDEEALLALDETEGTGGQVGVQRIEIRNFGDGRVLETPADSYVNAFGTVIGNPLSDNFLGDDTDSFDADANAVFQTTAGGQSLVSLTIDGQRLGVSGGDGRFEVDETLRGTLDGEPVSLTGTAYVDTEKRFLMYAVEDPDAAGLQRIDTFELDPTRTFLQQQQLEESQHASGSQTGGEVTPEPTVSLGDAQAIALRDLGVEPGDTLVVRTEGDYNFGASNDATDVARFLAAVFSSTDTLLGPTEARRVPDAIGVDGLPSFSAEQREAFGLFNVNNTVTVVVPEGAEYLFVGTIDPFASDNSDPDDDFGVTLSTYTPSERVLFFSGIPTPNGGMVASSERTVSRYEVAPEPFTGSTIPFLPKSVDDAFANPTTTDFMLVRRQGQIVSPADSSVFQEPGTSRSPTLQASFAIEGQGLEQRSFLFLSSGALLKSSEDKVHIAQGSRGSVRFGAQDTPFFVFADVNSQQNATGDHFFGPNLDYAVLSTDGISNADTDPDLDLGEASLTPFDLERERARAEVYSYHHLIERTESADGLGDQVTFGTLNGYVGAIGQSRIRAFPDIIESPHILSSQTGTPDDVTITKHPTNTISASFAFADPTEESFVQSAEWNFGGDGTFRGTLVDDDVFGARNSNSTASTINGDQGQGNTFNLSGLRGIMVSSQTLMQPGAELLGTETCRCEYLSWGFWSGRFDTSSENTLNQGRRERVHMGSWVAGDLPEASELAGMTGTATYTGHAIGEVASQGGQYIATGDFTNEWDFGARSGQVRIDDFDGRNFSSAVSSENARDYGGVLEGPNGLQGRVDGSFFRGGGDPAAETGGRFYVRGEGYRASGTFAGRK